MKKQALLLIGALLFILGLALKLHLNQGIITHPQSDTPSSITKLEIPSLKLDITVITGGFIYGNWILTQDKAQYFIPSNQTDIVIYAHDTQNLFGKLKQLSTGDEVDLALADGKISKYQVTTSKQVLPTAMSVINPKEDNTLVLFTCDGWLDSKRLILTAKLVPNV